MKRIVVGLVAALAGAGCTAPVFEPDVAGLQDIIRTYQSVPVVAVAGSSGVPDTDRDGNPDFSLREDRLTYLPHKSGNRLDATKGFVIRDRADEEKNELYYRWDVDSGVLWARAPTDYPADDGVPWMWPVTLKNNTSLAAVVFQGGDFQTYLERLYADTGMGQVSFQPPPPWVDLSNRIKSDLALGPVPVVVGVSVNADALPGQDYLYALVRDGGNYWEARSQLADSGLMGFMQTVPPGGYALPFLGTPRHLAYYRDEFNFRSYAQWREWDGRWVTWAWKGPPGPVDFEELPAIDHRIDAVITHAPGSSLLFSAEKQVGRLYAYDGFGIPPALVAEFPLGELRFIGEMHTTFDEVNWYWWLLFSRAVRSGDSVAFEIRAITIDGALDAFAP